MHSTVADLKPATKALIFQEWQAECSFDEQLEIAHG
jgi:hypothetical protein